MFTVFSVLCDTWLQMALDDTSASPCDGLLAQSSRSFFASQVELLVALLPGEPGKRDTGGSTSESHSFLQGLRVLKLGEGQLRELFTVDTPERARLA